MTGFVLARAIVDQPLASALLQTTAGCMIVGRNAEAGAAGVAESAGKPAERADREDAGRRPRSAAQA